MAGEINNKEKTSDKWGYAVCFGTVITFIAGIGHVNSFGLIYNDFIADTNSSGKSLTTAHGVFAVMLAIGGLILNFLSKKISLRAGGTIGAIIFTIGSFLTVFISNTNQLPLTFGTLQGIGFGMMVPVCYSTLNVYFVRKRTTVMSICKAVQGIVLMGYPLFLKNILSSYGFRGTLLILSGISMHTIAGMVTMQNGFKKSTIKKTASCLEDGKPEIVELLNVKDRNDFSKEEPTKISLKEIRSKILDVFNLKMLKDPIYLNICLGQSFVNFSDITFFVLQPMLLFQYGYSKTEVAMCISICAGADVASRCFLAALSSVVTINTRLLYYMATLFTLVGRIVLLQLSQMTWIATVTGVLGVLRAWLHVTSPLVVSNHVEHEDFPGAYALFMLSTGLVNLLCAPVIGSLKDVYQDYVPALYALAACCAPCLIFWPLEYIVNRNRTKS